MFLDASYAEDRQDREAVEPEAAVHGAAVIALRKGLPADTDRDQLAAAALDAALYGLTCVSTRTLYAGMQASSVSVGLSA